MSYDLYNEIKKNRGENAEFGNIELSYRYAIKNLSKLNNIKSKKMIDIGTNMGTLPYLMHKKNGFEMVGAECREDAIKKGQNRYPEISDRLYVVGKNLSEFQDESFDVVTMFDVIEHIPDAENYLKREVFRILRPGGIFIFQTPNARINPLFEMIRTKSFTAYKEYHCSLQTPKSLRKILKNCGFKAIKIEKYTVDSEFNRRKLRRYFGVLSIFILKVFEKVPLNIYPNLWGTAIK